MAKVYIAGPITGDPDYKQKFAAVEEKLRELGLEPVNPAEAPEGLTYKEYIDRGIKLLTECSMICMLPGSNKSDGAILERTYANTVRIPVLEAYSYTGEWKIRGAH